MSDKQHDEMKNIPAHRHLTAQQKERLRAARRILIEYLIENGYLTQYRHISTRRNENNQTTPNPTAKLPEAESL